MSVSNLYGLSTILHFLLFLNFLVRAFASDGQILANGLAHSCLITSYFTPANSGTIVLKETPFSGQSFSSLTCWGTNQAGQATPPVLSPSSYFVQVSAGYLHTCATVLTWQQRVTEGQSFTPSSDGIVRFGSEPNWFLKSVKSGSSVLCSAANFGLIRSCKVCEFQLTHSPSPI